MGAPFADLISLDYQAASLGFLPITLPRFLKRVSTNEENSITKLTSLISKSLRLHTYRMLGKHRQLTLIGRRHKETVTLSTTQTHTLTQNITQNTPSDALPRNVQESLLNDNPHSHLYYDENEDPDLVGDHVTI